MAMTNYVILPIGDSIKAAWDKTYGSKGTFWASIVIMFLIGIAFGTFEIALEYFTAKDSTFQEGGFGANVIGVLFEIMSYLFQMGLLYIGLLRAANLPITYTQIFYPFNTGIALRLIGVYIIEVILLFFCILVMILPPAMKAGGVHIPVLVVLTCMTLAGIAMIFFLVRFIFAMAFVLERKSNPFAAVRDSFRITRHNFWEIVIILLIEIGLFALGIITLGIALIWIIPFSYVLYGEMYKRLLPNLTA